MSDHNTWRVEMDAGWPFDMRIVLGNGESVTIPRYAHSSKQNTIEDVREAIGFPHDEREAIRARLAEQERHVTMMAAAPALLEALKYARDRIKAHEGEHYGSDPLAETIDDAISQAEGGE